MEKFRLDHDWKFHFGDIEAHAATHQQSYMAAKAGGAIGGGNPDINTEGFEEVNLPHDWAVYNEFDEAQGPSRGYKARGKGWYFKKFRLEEDDKNKELYIEFGGVSSHCVVYLNGSVVYRNFCGYNSFVVNITDMAQYGDKLNSLAVYVDAEVIEGWWYEGAGIYRHVDLFKYPKTHIKPWGVYVNPQKKSADVWEVEVKSTVIADGNILIKSYILDEKGNTVGKEESQHEIINESEICQKMLTYSPYLWDIDDVHMYSMVTEIYVDGELTDTLTTPFGFRTIEIDSQKGFFLNGRPIKLYGTCNHQDHAGVGVAVPDSVNEYRIQLLKEMGTNAYRCSHGNVDKYILDLCDKYGLLVMDEARNFNTSPDGLQQVRDMVIRDRNHPSVVMYSVLNEEPLQGTFIGQKLAKTICKEIHKLDTTRFSVASMNNGYLSEENAGESVDITGLNYNTFNYDNFHEKFPEKPMISSETDSAFQTRGVYKTDFDKHVIDCYDTEAAPWGNTYRDGFMQVDTRDYCMGMFIWTGFDYRGEPTPFAYPSISTQFGIMDTCGFKKDAFYLNQAFFKNEPVIHLLPHWNHKDGENVKVMVYTNCTEAELFLNGKSMGKKDVHKYEMCEWTVPFEAGELKVIGTKDGKEYTDIQKTALVPEKIVLEKSKEFLLNGADDAVIVNVSLADKNGVFVPYENSLVEFESINCRIIGVGNGDPNSHESDKANNRHLFNGRCQVIIEGTGEENPKLIVKCNGMNEEITFDTVSDNSITYIESVKEKYINEWRKYIQLTDTMPDPTAEIADHDMNTWELVEVGNGGDPMFDGMTGYAQYRAKADISPNHKQIIFNRVRGDEVYIYLNGKLYENKECPYGNKLGISVQDISGETQITVIIKSNEPKASAGIEGAVLIME